MRVARLTPYVALTQRQPDGFLRGRQNLGIYLSFTVVIMASAPNI